MENQDIDKMFNDAGKSAEENPTFPSFEKVWEKVEEKLDKKEQKKRTIPIWLPYGIAAGLALTFGVLYFVNDKDTKIEPQIASKDYGKPINPSQTETPKKVEEINKTFEENLVKNAIKPAEGKDIIAYHDVAYKNDEFDDLYNELREKYKTDDIYVKKDENGKIIASVNNQSDFSITNKRFHGVELERKSNDAIFSQEKSESTNDEKYITRVDKGKTIIAKSELPPPAIPKRLETTDGLVTNEVFESTYTPPPPPPSTAKSSTVAKVSALYAAEKAREISESTKKKMLALGLSLIHI